MKIPADPVRENITFVNESNLFNEFKRYLYWW